MLLDYQLNDSWVEDYSENCYTSIIMVDMVRIHQLLIYTGTGYIVHFSPPVYVLSMSVGYCPTWQSYNKLAIHHSSTPNHSSWTWIADFVMCLEITCMCAGSLCGTRQNASKMAKQTLLISLTAANQEPAAWYSSNKKLVCSSNMIEQWWLEKLQHSFQLDTFPCRRWYWP